MIMGKFSPATMKKKKNSVCYAMLAELLKYLQKKHSIVLTKPQIEQIERAHQTVQEILQTDLTVYGINTGFGKLSQVRIGTQDLETLQVNLLRSHACGVGPAVDDSVVRIMLYLKIMNLARGHSGCSRRVVEKLIELLNRDILPVIPSQGSVGASGDLAPLAHMCLPLIGEGEVKYQNQIYTAAELVRQGTYTPVKLGPKDGLSLINGTQYSTALLVFAYQQAEELVLLAELAAAMSVEASLATDVPFAAEIQRVRGQAGQVETARHLRNFLQGSAIIQSHRNCPKVQDPYSFRCIPQVIGAVRDTLNFVQGILEKEILSVTDNPLVFPKTGEILSGGNFHAEPLALGADYLTIALVELGNLAERRIANMMDPAMSSLPAFLVPSSGLNSGFMIAQVTAAALCAENRTLAMPASVESIPTSANQEDHVSMAPNAALKLLRVIDNLQKIVWIEFLCAAQGMEFRLPLKGGRGTLLAFAKVRSLVKFLKADRIMFTDLRQAKDFFADRRFINEVHKIAQKSRKT